MVGPRLLSDPTPSIEYMFDNFSESALLSAMGAAQRAERVAVARRLLAAGRLCLLRMAAVDAGERAQWCIDNWEAVAAEIGAELGISRGRASAQMNYGLELIERLPRLGAAFAAGLVEFRVVAAVVFRTGLIADAAVLARVDEELSRRAGSWNMLSRSRLGEVIDRWVVEFDPAALRASREAAEDRHVEFGPARAGMVEFWGALRAPDAAALERSLDRLAGSVCTDDPRTRRQRRADALGALAAAPQGGLSCECAAPQCPAEPGAPATPVVVHVLAEAGALSGGGGGGYLPGYGPVPPAMLHDLASRARLRPLPTPEQLRAEPRYRPSAALADFIRCRDLHCRFPGCDKPAEYCDIDHTVPWHRGGPGGWAERQFRDGTIEFSSPSGRTDTTRPSGALLFPGLAEPTEKAVREARSASAGTGRTLMMPTRRRTRAAERAARIRWERGLNEARWAADPPPY